MSENNGNGAGDLAAPEPVAADETTVGATVQRFLESAKASTVFGEPVKDEKGIVIPAAEVTLMFGFGLGAAKTPPQSAAGEAKGTGGGGGGYLLARPVATLVVTPMGVRQEPIVDVTKIALGVLTAVGVLGGLIWRSRNGQQP
jgi:uncharacterized spore protein YtfJ